MENNTWYCEHCEAEFTPKPGGKKPRCHTCMRTTGLTALSTDAPARKVPTQTLIGVAALALAAGGLLWFYATQRAESPPDEAPAPGGRVGGAGPSPPPPPPPPRAAPGPGARPRRGALRSALRPTRRRPIRRRPGSPRRLLPQPRLSASLRPRPWSEPALMPPSCGSC